MDVFYDLLTETTTRDNFHSHNKEYYKTMFDTLHTSGLADLFIAEYENEKIAAIIVTYFKDMATYYFGASGQKHRNVMAPYLLHWHAIHEAKNRGMRYYDLFGISPEGAVNHVWHGVTEFKRKFGGEEVSSPPAKEISLNRFLYKIYSVYKRLKK